MDIMLMLSSGEIVSLQFAQPSLTLTLILALRVGYQSAWSSC
jgi:hypothetical protein